MGMGLESKRPLTDATACTHLFLHPFLSPLLPSLLHPSFPLSFTPPSFPPLPHHPRSGRVGRGTRERTCTRRCTPRFPRYPAGRGVLGSKVGLATTTTSARPFPSPPPSASCPPLPTPRTAPRPPSERLLLTRLTSLACKVARNNFVGTSWSGCPGWVVVSEELRCSRERVTFPSLLFLLSLM